MFDENPMSRGKIYSTGNQNDKPVKAKSRSGVIKKRQVRVDEPRRIAVREIAADSENGDAVQPVIEDGQVVGVNYQCSCGKLVRIRFEFEEPVVPTEEAEE